MKRLAAAVLVWLVGGAIWSTAPAAPAAPQSGAIVNLTGDLPRVSLEGRLSHFADAQAQRPFEAITEQAFEPLPDFRSLGYDRRAHWFRARVTREAGAPSRWILSIGAPDLEEVDVYIAHGGNVSQYALGYHRPFTARPLRTRDFAVPVDVPGITDIYFRVRTKNAINVHAHLWEPAAFSANETQANFWRGIYFGILLIAVVLYVILGTRLRDTTLAAYAAYLASQTLLHLGSAGYIPVLLPQDGAWFTDALPRIGWLGSAMSIVLMWTSLLDLKRTFPRVHRLYLFTVAFNLALLPFALMPSLVGAALLYVVKFANALNIFNFFTGMGVLALMWSRSRRVELLLYLVAFIVPALGTAVNYAVNLGLVRQSAWNLNFYPLAMLVHVLVMSFGLAMRLRQLQRDKAEAEHAAAFATGRAEEQRRFVAMLSHEFGNPLAAIDRSAQMIQIKARELPPPEAQRLVQIRENVSTLTGLVDNFLMTEALDNGALQVSRRDCDVRALISAAVEQQGEAAHERVRVADGEPASPFSLDPLLVGLAIGNLLANALRYSPAGSEVEVAAHSDGEGLHVRVTDFGPGLAAEELQRLGTPYFRGTSSFGKKGSGLGFYFAQRIVEAHGGTLTARSTPGAGLTAEILLPAQARESV